MKEQLNSSSEPEISFESACTALREQVEARKINEVRMEKLILSLAETNNEEVARWNERLGQINTEIEGIRETIAKLETGDIARQKLLGCTPDNNIPLARKYADECREKLEVASESYKLARQRDTLLNQIKRIEKQALETLRQTICTETNKRLGALVQMEQLRVAKIDGALTLTSDRVAERKDVSEGQSLSVAYAFLTALLSEAPFDLPFIVDSPAVSLDLDVRREVGRIIPGLFNQMIMFVISSEQAGFAETFYGREDTRFVSLSKAKGGKILCEYGLEAFKKRTKEAPAK